MPLTATLSFPTVPRGPSERQPAGSRPGAVCTSAVGADHGVETLPRIWLAALPVFLPAFVLATPPSARLALQLLAAFAVLALLALTARALARCRRLGRRTPDAPTLLGLLAALAAALPLGTGLLTTALLAAMLLLAAELPSPHRPGAGLVATALFGALAADAGTIALGSGRGIELVALGGALALFARLADEGPTVVLGGHGRRRPSHVDLVREGALALAVLVSLVAYLALLSARAGTIGVLGVDGWTALLVFAAGLALVWHRGRRRPGSLHGDPAVLAAAALAGLATAAASVSGPGFPLP